MEILITALLIISALILVYVYSKYTTSEYNKRIFIDPITSTSYYVQRRIEVKDPNTGSWYKSILCSKRCNIRELYAIEEEEFFETFVPLNKWKDEV